MAMDQIEYCGNCAMYEKCKACIESGKPCSCKIPDKEAH